MFSLANKLADSKKAYRWQSNLHPIKALEMIHNRSLTLGIYASLFLLNLHQSILALAQDPAMTIAYPTSKVVDQIDDYHGTKISDPFRWLEDLDSQDTKSWVTQQNQVTFDYLERIPARSRFKERLTKLWNFERFGLPRQYGDVYFYTYNNGLQNQNVLYTAKTLDPSGLAQQKLVLDPNLLSNDGTVALSGYVPSDDGSLLAYGVAQSGSDWNIWRVRQVQTGNDLPDTIRWVKFSSVAWTSDNAGFFYSRYDEPTENEFTGINYYQKLYYHRIGTQQTQDILVYDRPDQKEWGFGGSVSDDGKFLIISVWRGTEKKNLLFYAPILDGKIPTRSDVVELVSDFTADWQFLGNDSSRFYLETDESAPKHRIVAIDLQMPSKESWQTIVPQSNESIEGSSLLGDKLLIHYLKDATSIITPTFSPANLAWMERGGMYAVANLRGGGEYGRDWHELGMLDKKQAVFDDFISAAEYLLRENYTNSSKLAISGRSNGGLLVGATMVQRPDLFAVALPAVGVMDMLRFHKFTIGWAWVSEFGSSENPEQSANLLKYSPLHGPKPGRRYPATLITTGDHDDRVVPGHSYKFAARLQSCQSGTRPTLIRIETSAGHGAGTPVSKLIDTAADTLAFVWKNFGLE